MPQVNANDIEYNWSAFIKSLAGDCTNLKHMTREDAYKAMVHFLHDLEFKMIDQIDYYYDNK